MIEETKIEEEVIDEGENLNELIEMLENLNSILYKEKEEEIKEFNKEENTELFDCSIYTQETLIPHSREDQQDIKWFYITEKTNYFGEANIVGFRLEDINYIIGR